MTGFILDKDCEGWVVGAEEKKMGIKGSSTRQVFFNNCKVPVDNLLGSREEGFKIALNILNIGRIKLAGATLGQSRCARPMANFGRCCPQGGQPLPLPR